MRKNAYRWFEIRVSLAVIPLKCILRSISPSDNVFVSRKFRWSLYWLSTSFLTLCWLLSWPSMYWSSFEFIKKYFLFVVNLLLLLSNELALFFICSAKLGTLKHKSKTANTMRTALVFIWKYIFLNFVFVFLLLFWSSCVFLFQFFFVCNFLLIAIF